ncbi:MAG: hypothetical protein B7X86_02640 [Sphingobacteriales bacterium 17-39-43]|uniref:Uncharacterized protein n=1 Tax=Daejeonella rubra TaxID=990371 RepID=A0A1G9XMB6_9SPHI|nr:MULTISPECIES: hypothetical protein [Daejeonella]OYY05340.1 MAG: hypothetical protein B7Y76_01215 [Sphingobacteriia bacterium 35-40-5]OYZ33233.1 MAG: hypothetical protein B7Y24_02640 [Sphingobacteriales bacterium 16-39-50]OZA26642.1 MAG: hypothetical protein B7X86_02640 [Sphingobacteriales bacterium 17-39-43]SDM97345.1 hypothetical protein SAMN05421813_13121 [Daejeonella rubra]HQT21805.1 hypothetical protein [Daejeonella sp.]
METITLNPQILSMTEFGSNINRNDETDNHYIPGVCNIGKEEIKRRKVAALASLVVTVILIMVLLLLPENRLWRLTLFVPVTSFAVSFQQWYFRFCVAFGIKGIINFGNLGKNDTVEQANFRKKDRAKAWQMINTGILAGIIAALIFYYLPV